jgi:hypothetical protein
LFASQLRNNMTDDLDVEALLEAPFQKEVCVHCVYVHCTQILQQKPKDVENGKDKREEEDRAAAKRAPEDKDDRDSKRRYIFLFVL